MIDSYGYYDSPIGILEIGCSEDKLKSLLFVNFKEHVESKNRIVTMVIKQLDEYFEGVRFHFDIPLEISGTEYQKKVWNELQSIPYGETISYKEQAVRLGNPNSSRAVGNANSKNQISIIIPCHRVIGSNKKLTGYAGGLDRKGWLLNHEKSHSNL